MTNERAGVLCTRAINQYRRRDILPYVGLRYYLSASAARRDRWAREVAPHILLTSSQPSYLHTYHFKDLKPDSPVEYRDIHVPGPNTALVEASLLDECSKFSEFTMSDSVYSYRLAQENDRSGIFSNYFVGYRERHSAITRACISKPSGFVLHTDIRKFYPSIDASLALTIWAQVCEVSGISSKGREIGERMLFDHASVAAITPNCKGILTGPMFSHLIGNLILKSLDAEISAYLPDGYFRYVDDICLVGDRSEVDGARNILKRRLSDLGFQMNEDKELGHSASEWISGADSQFTQDETPNWMTLVDHTKRLLLAYPEQRIALMEAFSAADMRIPILDYSEAIRESKYLSSFINRLRWYGFRFNTQGLNIRQILGEAEEIRERISLELSSRLDHIDEVKGLVRKRMIPRLRYLAGRLLYLGRSDLIAKIGARLSDIPELKVHGAILKSIGSRDATELISLGTNTVQPAAQVLRLQDAPIKLQGHPNTEAEKQGLAIFNLNGIKVDTESTGESRHELREFAEWNERIPKWNDINAPFIRELTCLHGSNRDRQHSTILDSAFDIDEQLSFDAIEQLQQSS